MTTPEDVTTTDLQRLAELEVQLEAAANAHPWPTVRSLAAKVALGQVPPPMNSHEHGSVLVRAEWKRWEPVAHRGMARLNSELEFAFTARRDASQALRDARKLLTEVQAERRRWNSSSLAQEAARLALDRRLIAADRNDLADYKHERQQQLDALQAALDAQAADIAARQEGLDQRQRALDDAAAAVEQWSRSLAAQARLIEDREQQLDALQSRIQEQAAEVSGREASLEQLAREVDAKHAETLEKGRQVDALAHRVAAGEQIPAWELSSYVPVLPPAPTSVELEEVIAALNATGWSVSKAAERLRVSPSKLDMMMARSKAAFETARAEYAASRQPAPAAPRAAPLPPPPPPSLEWIKVKTALAASGFSVLGAASLLGVSPSYIDRLMAANRADLDQSKRGDQP